MISEETPLQEFSNDLPTTYYHMIHDSVLSNFLSTFSQIFQRGVSRFLGDRHAPLQGRGYEPKTIFTSYTSFFAKLLADRLDSS